MKTGKILLASEVAKYAVACSVAGIIITKIGEKIQKPFIQAIGLGTVCGGIFTGGFACGLCVTVEEYEDNQ